MDVRETQSNEKRLINASVMRDDWLKNGENEYVHDTNAVLDSIDSQPTVDAVEIVRCRECKHWHEETGFCEKHSYFVDGDGVCCSPADSPNWTMFDPDDFCSYGERKGGAN